MSIQDPAQLQFRERTDVRSRRKAPSSFSAGWLVVVLVGAVGFVLLVRTILERSAATAGPSSFVTAGAPVRSDAELKAELAAELGVAAPEEADSSPVTSMPAPAVGGSMVYRCVPRNGAVIFQSQPCAADQQTTRVIHAPAEVARSRPYVAAAAVANTVVQNTVINNNQRLADERERRRRQCDAAKRNRDRTLERVGLARTYDLLQRLDAQVYEACKGL